MTVVAHLLRGIDPRDGLEDFFAPVSRASPHSHRCLGLQLVGQSVDVVCLEASEAVSESRFAIHELQRQQPMAGAARIQ